MSNMLRHVLYFFMPIILLGCGKSGKGDVDNSLGVGQSPAAEMEAKQKTAGIPEQSLGCADGKKNNFLLTVSAAGGELKISSSLGNWVFDRKIGILPPPSNGVVSEVSIFEVGDGRFSLMLSYFDPARGATMKPDDVMVSVTRLSPDERREPEFVMNGVCFETGLVLKRYMQSTHEGQLKDI